MAENVGGRLPDHQSQQVSTALGDPVGRRLGSLTEAPVDPCGRKDTGGVGLLFLRIENRITYG